MKYDVDLVAPEWDAAEPVVPRHRYAIFSLPRTGSELVCARLRRDGLGVPVEYFNLHLMPMMAARWGCQDAGGAIDRDRYLAELERRRTTPNGVFGTKLQPFQLANFVGDDATQRLAFLRRFDRVLAMTRRDRVLQAISLVRADSNRQWHVVAGEKAHGMAIPEDALFGMIDRKVAGFEASEDMVFALVAALDPARVRAIQYEDLADENLVRGTLAWLGGDAADQPRVGRADHALPVKANEAESLRIKSDYLAFKRATARR